MTKRKSNDPKIQDPSAVPAKKIKTEIAPAKKWCFTFNNYNELHIAELLVKLKPHKYVFQEEIGEEGTSHLQGWVEFNKKLRPAGHVGIKQIHWSKQKADADLDAIKYCCKEDSKKPDGRRWANFTLPTTPKDEFMECVPHAWQTRILEMIKGPADKRKVVWIWSRLGMTGKSVFAKHLALKHEAIMVRGKRTDVFHGISSVLEKKGCLPILIVTIPRKDGNECCYEALEQIKDGHFFSGKYESQQCIFDTPHVIVFANEPPIRDAMSTDRWEIINID